MAEIMEIGAKDMKKSFAGLKKKIKEKPIFFAALIIVVIIAIFKLLTKKKDDTTTYAYTPTGFDGYPTLSDSMMDDILNGGGSDFGGFDGDNGFNVGGSSGNGNSSVEDDYFRDEKYDKEYKERMDDENQTILDKVFNMDTTGTNGDVYGKDGSLIFSKNKSYSVITGTGADRDLQEKLEKADNLEYRNNILNQMKSNAAAWGSASKAEKEILEKENERLSKSVGLTKGSDGVWRNPDGSRAWSAPTTSTSTSTSTSSGVSYDKNVDYAQKIKDAKANGASQAEIDRLTKQRNAKIAGEKLNQDGTKKTSSSSSSSSSSKTSSSSSSSKTSSSSSSSSSSKNTNKPTGTVIGKVTWTKTTNKDGSTTNVAKDKNGKTVAKYTTSKKKTKK